MIVHDFHSQLGMSWGDAESKTAALMLSVPHAVSVRGSTNQEDRDGTDAWVLLSSGHELSVDIKHRTFDPIDRYNEDTLIVEWRSSVESDTPGWSVDPAKRTDYVLYWFAPTKRYALVPFPLFHAAAVANEGMWRAEHGTRYSVSSRNGRGWTTLWSAVPRQVVWAAMYRIANGRAA